MIDFVLSENPATGEITVETPGVEEIVLSAAPDDADSIEAAESDTSAAATEAAPAEAPAVEAAAEAAVEEDIDDEPQYHSDYDAEVASIFTEEASELIDVSEQALHAWRAQPDSADLRSALKRPMHTLKGGARMAGVTPMGDLSHELETLVMQMDSGLVPTTDTAFEVLQTCLDELARMRDAVAASQPVAHATRLIRKIHSLSEPPKPVAAKKPAAAPAASTAPAPAPAPAPVAPSAAVAQNIDAPAATPAAAVGAVASAHAPSEPEPATAEPIATSAASSAPDVGADVASAASDDEADLASALAALAESADAASPGAAPSWESSAAESASPAQFDFSSDLPQSAELADSAAGELAAGESAADEAESAPAYPSYLTGIIDPEVAREAIASEDGLASLELPSNVEPAILL